ncbi:MAG TPA: O-antigen ligase family protein [Candidatus Sulfotelmatobacter sp.]|nr:O-antigen ligase family protein [Candidatus Sulfotelmatobacter sp.]
MTSSSSRLAAEPTLLDRLFVFAVILLGILVVRITTPDQEFSALVETSSPLSEAVWGGLYVIAVVGLARHSAGLAALIRSSWLVVALVALAVLSTLWSDDPGATARRAIGLVGTTACAYFIVSRFTLESFIDTFAVVVIAAAVLSLAVVIVSPDAGLMHLEYAGALRGIFAHKNRLGLFLAFGIITVAMAAWRRRGAPSAFFWAGGVLCLVELAATRSATALLTLLVCAVAMVVAFAANRRRARPLIAGIVVLAVALVAGAALATDGTQNPVFALLGRDATLTGRLEIWTHVVQAIAAHPLVGYGYDVFWEPGGSFLQFNPGTSGWRPFHAHDGYLELALDLGLVGLAMMVVVLGQSARAGWRFVMRRYTFDRACPLAALAFFVTLNISEAYIAKYNDFDWIVFLTFFLFTLLPETASSTAQPRREPAPARFVIGAGGLVRSRTAPVRRPTGIR